MKLTTLLLGLLLTSLCYSQNSAKSVTSTPAQSATKEDINAIPSANLLRISNGGNFTYQFVSNSVMTPERATRWEDRFLAVYTDLISISIDANTQQIELVLPSSHSNSELEEMVIRFGYSGYQITN